MNRARAIVGSYLGVLVFAAPIFLAAGRIAYRQGLLYVGMALVGTTLSHALMPAGSDLTEDRASRAGDGEAWDKRILVAHAALSVVMFAVAGLDSGRYGWSGPMPAAVPVAGVALMFMGQVVFALAKRENAFFSSTVRIQDERGHRVCDTGLYRFVRHPGYVGMLLSLLAFPLVMASWWAFVPTCAAASLLVARTVLEDRFLMERLTGYAEYAARTRWRLVPGMF